MKLSVVIPVMNEEDNIKPLIEQVDIALKEIEYELILVDDGSSDKTINNIEQYALKNTKLLVFNRNYGQTSLKRKPLRQFGTEDRKIW